MRASAAERTTGIWCLRDELRWETPHWFALHTRSRHEKKVEQELNRREIRTFLPLRRLTRRWSDRTQIISEPLFKGYVFVHTPLKDRWTVLNTPGVARFVGPRFSDPVRVPPQDLEAIQRFISEDIALDPFPYLRAGMRVYVKSGPFRGVEGFIVRKDDHCRLVVTLDLLMQSVSITIDQACVEVL